MWPEAGHCCGWTESWASVKHKKLFPQWNSHQTILGCREAGLYQRSTFKWEHAMMANVSTFHKYHLDFVKTWNRRIEAEERILQRWKDANGEWLLILQQVSWCQSRFRSFCCNASWSQYLPDLEATDMTEALKPIVLLSRKTHTPSSIRIRTLCHLQAAVSWWPLIMSWSNI